MIGRLARDHWPESDHAELCSARGIGPSVDALHRLRIGEVGDNDIGSKYGRVYLRRYWRRRHGTWDTVTATTLAVGELILMSMAVVSILLLIPKL